jgi:hypothetical protein
LAVGMGDLTLAKQALAWVKSWIYTAHIHLLKICSDPMFLVSESRLQLTPLMRWAAFALYSHVFRSDLHPTSKAFWILSANSGVVE